MTVGFYKSVEKALGVPIIDPAIVALKRQCDWVSSRKWFCAPPPEEE